MSAPVEARPGEAHSGEAHSGEAHSGEVRAERLRLTFDQSFAVPARVDTAPREAFLAIRVGTAPWAIRLADITGLHVGKAITPIPSAAPFLRGIAGFRGAVVPVFDLPGLLGPDSEQAPRWLVLLSAAPIGLAFNGFERQIHALKDEILPQRDGGPHHSSHCLRLPEHVLPIVDVRSIVERVGSDVVQVPPKGET